MAKRVGTGEYIEGGLIKDGTDDENDYKNRENLLTPAPQNVIKDIEGAGSVTTSKQANDITEAEHRLVYEGVEEAFRGVLVADSFYYDPEKRFSRFELLRKGLEEAFRVTISGRPVYSLVRCNKKSDGSRKSERSPDLASFDVGELVTQTVVAVGKWLEQAEKEELEQSVSVMIDEFKKYKIRHVYKTLEDAPRYPHDFFEESNGTKRVKIDYDDMKDNLREIEGGDWYKVYKNGYLPCNNEKGYREVSIHFCESSSGQVYDVEVKNRWS
jgi:hypothetical protein